MCPSCREDVHNQCSGELAISGDDLLCCCGVVIDRRPSVLEPPASEILAAARAVAERLADLDAWIERRAAQIAAPAIGVAGRAAAAEVSAAKAETQRQADLVAELRFIIASRDRVIDGLRKERDRLRQEAAREITGNG